MPWLVFFVFARSEKSSYTQKKIAQHPIAINTDTYFRILEKKNMPLPTYGFSPTFTTYCCRKKVPFLRQAAFYNHFLPASARYCLSEEFTQKKVRSRLGNTVALSLVLSSPLKVLFPLLSYVCQKDLKKWALLVVLEKRRLRRSLSGKKKGEKSMIPLTITWFQHHMA